MKRLNPAGMSPTWSKETIARVLALVEKYKPATGSTQRVYPRDVILIAVRKGLDALEAPEVLPLLMPEVIERLEEMAREMSTPELPLTVEDAIRAAVASGLEAIEWHGKRRPGKRGAR